MATKKAAAKTAKPAMASGIVIPPNSTTSMAEAVKQPDAGTNTAPSSGALAATDPAILTDILRSSLSSDAAAPGASAVLDAAASSAKPGQEPTVRYALNDMNPAADMAPGGRTLVALPPDSEQDQAPQPAAVGVDQAAGNAPIAPIHDLADARALPDATGGVHQAPVYIVNSPLAIRAFKDHDGRSMAVVWTGYTLAKAAITD